MDLPPPVEQSSYDKIVSNIHAASSTVCQLSCMKAVKEEQQLTTEKNLDSNKLTVSGDGTWKKRGFTSLFGVSTLIGWLSGKVLDIYVKSSFCKSCEYWASKINTAEYEEWKMEHEETCSINHEGSAGKMEVESMKEMFSRSVERYNVMYTNYIGDGDSKTYRGLLDLKLYGDVEVTKKECIGHVQKRMGSRLRQCVKKNKGISGRNKLTGKLIDKLTIHYGLAIRRNSNSVEEMEKVIWATFNHYSSTDTEPNHKFCPQGTDSWCGWQKAKAEGNLHLYHHQYTLPPNVLIALKPIYTDLSTKTLLERCLGGYNQNSNESLNNLIWRISPKEVHCGLSIVEIAANIAVCTFNDGTSSLLQIMKTMDVKCGSNAHRWAAAEDSRRLSVAERAAATATKESRILRKRARRDEMEVSTSQEGEFYGPGIDDSM